MNLVLVLVDVFMIVDKQYEMCCLFCFFVLFKGCEVHVVSRTLSSLKGCQKRAAARRGRRRRRKKLAREGERDGGEEGKGEEEGEGEGVLFGVGLKGIVLRETTLCYHILVQQEEVEEEEVEEEVEEEEGKKKKKKREREKRERVVHVPKEGTILSFKMNRQEDDDKGEESWWEVSR